MKTEKELQNTWGFTSAEIVNYLKTVRDFYINHETTQWERDRILGLFEACLVILGVIKMGQKFDYKMVEDTKWFLGIFPTKKKYLRKETLREHLLRLVGELLEK